MTIHMRGHIVARDVHIGERRLPGTLRMPDNAFGLIVFAHGSGSSRLSPRNIMVAEALNDAGFATLLFDLLEPEEEEAHNRAMVFDIPLLARRVVEAVQWVGQQSSLSELPIGLFGASTGAAAALVAASQTSNRIAAVVSRGGRADLAGEYLAAVKSPTLLIVGGADHGVIELNQEAFARLVCVKKLEIVPDATHLFSEPGAMRQVIELAIEWFSRHLHG